MTKFNSNEKKWLIIIPLLVALVCATPVYHAIHGTDNEAAQQTTTRVVEPKDVKPATPDLTGLVGQKWSNAMKIMESRNIGVTTATVLTSDGKTPIIASNWTVKSVSFDKNSGVVTVNLDHDTDYDASKMLDDASKNVQGKLDNGTIDK